MGEIAERMLSPKMIVFITTVIICLFLIFGLIGFQAHSSFACTRREYDNKIASSLLPNCEESDVDCSKEEHIDSCNCVNERIKNQYNKDFKERKDKEIGRLSSGITFVIVSVCLFIWLFSGRAPEEWLDMIGFSAIILLFLGCCLLVSYMIVQDKSLEQEDRLKLTNIGGSLIGVSLILMLCTNFLRNRKIAAAFVVGMSMLILTIGTSLLTVKNYLPLSEEERRSRWIAGLSMMSLGIGFFVISIILWGLYMKYNNNLQLFKTASTLFLISIVLFVPGIFMWLNHK